MLKCIFVVRVEALVFCKHSVCVTSKTSGKTFHITNDMVSWLVDSLVGWMVGWMVDCFVFLKPSLSYKCDIKLTPIKFIFQERQRVYYKCDEDSEQSQALL